MKIENVTHLPSFSRDSACGAWFALLLSFLFLFPLSGCQKNQPQAKNVPAAAAPNDKTAVAASQSQAAANEDPEPDSKTGGGTIGGGKTGGGKTESADAKMERSTDAEQASADNGWPVFRGNARSSGVVDFKMPGELEVLWEYKVPGGNGSFEGTAVIAKHSKTGKPIAYIGDLDGTLYALDLESGDEVWKTRPEVTLASLKAPPESEPREHRAFSFSASPAYHDGQIFIGDIDGIFYCFDESGELKWFYETESEISSSANFYDGQVLFGSQDAKLYLLDTKTGEKKWDLETPDQIRCSVTVADDRAFVAGCDGFFHIVDLKTGEEAGKVDIKSPTQSTPAVMGDRVYFGTEQDEFVAIDWKTAEGVWTFSDEEGPAPVRGCAAVTDGHVVFGARNRFVYSVDPSTGQKNWGVELKAKVDSSPVIVGQHIYVGSTDGRFYTLSLENGDKIWEKQFNGGFVSSPAVAFGKLVVATDRGVVYCLGKPKIPARSASE